MEKLLGYICIQHMEPLWRDKANYICEAVVPDTSDPVVHEQLWAQKLGGGRFEICCIPYLLYDLELGDVVSLDETGRVKEVLERSGRFVFRIWLGDAPIDRNRLFEDIKGMGGMQEWRTENFGAVDMPDWESASVLAAYLWERESKAELVYENGRHRPDAVP